MWRVDRPVPRKRRRTPQANSSRMCHAEDSTATSAVLLYLARPNSGLLRAAPLIMLAAQDLDALNSSEPPLVDRAPTGPGWLQRYSLPVGAAMRQFW